MAAVRTYERFMCGDMASARQQSDLAIALGRRLDTPAAEVIGRTAGARITILEGRVAEGLEQLDDVGVLLMSGEVDPLTTGMMLCELVCAAQGLALHDMACEWTEAMDRWRHGAAFGGLHGRCRVHRAEILRVSGPCAAAEDEALRACDNLRPWMRREFGWPLAELGNIRLRKGDLAGAEEAYCAAHEHVWCPHPGLALVRLAQGDLDAATALIAEAIDHPFQAPSKERPPFGDLVLAPLLEARSRSRRRPATWQWLDGPARPSAPSLAPTGARGWSPRPRWRRPAPTCSPATWTAPRPRVGRPPRRGRRWGPPTRPPSPRMVLGEAHARAGRQTTARLEWQAAASAFAAFGAEGQAARARGLLDAAPAEPACDEPTAAPATFRLDGDTRLVSFAEASAFIRDLKGFRYLAQLLADPGREFHVLDLVAVEQGTLPIGAAAAAVEDALRCNDPARADLAQRDREYLIAELARAAGLGGRLRVVGGDAERARMAVARRSATPSTGWTSRPRCWPPTLPTASTPAPTAATGPTPSPP